MLEAPLPSSPAELPSPAPGSLSFRQLEARVDTLYSIANSASDVVMASRVDTDETQHWIGNECKFPFLLLRDLNWQKIRKQYLFHIHSLCCNTPIQFKNLWKLWMSIFFWKIPISLKKGFDHSFGTCLLSPLSAILLNKKKHFNRLHLYKLLFKIQVNLNGMTIFNLPLTGRLPASCQSSSPLTICAVMPQSIYPPSHCWGVRTRACEDASCLRAPPGLRPGGSLICPKGSHGKTW